MNELIAVVNGEVKLDSRIIAEYFAKRHDNIIRDIKDEIQKLEIAGLGGALIFEESSYINEQNKIMPCYTMTEEGALQLAARYDAISRRKLILKIKELKEKATPQMQQLSPQLQLLIRMELKQKEIEAAVTEAKEEIQTIRDIISINPKAEWRRETNRILNLIGKQLKDYSKPRNDAYEALRSRANCRPSVLIANLKSRALGQGMAPSKVKDLTLLDVLENEPRLREIYIVIVKEMAIKHRVN